MDTPLSRGMGSGRDRKPGPSRKDFGLLENRCTANRNLWFRHHSDLFPTPPSPVSVNCRISDTSQALTDSGAFDNAKAYSKVARRSWLRYFGWMPGS